jgi:hypothetical protein
MTTSGTTAFALSGADLVLEAFDRLQIRPSEITADHMVSARRSMNLVQVRWANRGTNLWKVDPAGTPQSIPLVQGTATYNLPSATIMVLDVYRRFTQAGQDPIDTIMTPISRSDYAALPDKVVQAPPTIYYFDRQETTPTITFWQVPDSAASSYTLNLYTVQQIEDAAALASQTPDVPYRFLEALCADLALHLAKKYPPKPDSGITIADLRADAADAWHEAASEDRERVPMYLVPDLSGYFR